MSLKTQSSFRYGFEILKDKDVLDIQDENGAHSIVFPAGALCMSEVSDQLLKIFTAAGLDDYSVTYDKVRCRLKIFRVSGMPFDILIASGLNATMGIYETIGFTEGLDLTGNFEYESDSPIGKKFSPQWLLKKFVHCDQNKKLRQATKNESSSGDCCEVIFCGFDQYFEFEIFGQTNIPQSHRLSGRDIKGYDELVDFMCWAILAKPIEFFPDCSDLDDVYKIKLERSSNGKKGTGFKLREQIRTLGCGYFRTGRMKWRVTKKPSGN